MGRLHVVDYIAVSSGVYIPSTYRLHAAGLGQ